MTRDWNEDGMRELAGCLLQELTRTFKAMPQTENLRAAADFAALSEHLHTHFAMPLTLADLARCIDRSESTVGRLIHSHSGLSPVNWINQTRIQRARSILSTTRLSVSETGARVGIPDPFYFSKLFKKWTGESPLAYRKHTPML
jgi:YesN/AraC family two-component response regulator